MKLKNDDLFEIILQEIKENNKVTEKYLSNKYNMSERTIRRYIKILKDKGIIRLVGNGVKKYWVIDYFK